MNAWNERLCSLMNKSETWPVGYLSRQTLEPFFPGLTKHLEDLNKMLIPYVMLFGQGINLAHIYIYINDLISTESIDFGVKLTWIQT